MKNSINNDYHFTSGSYFSRGKLLLTAEYLILKGAEGLALPLQLGQEIRWRDRGEGEALEWITLVNGDEWFRAIFSGPDYSVVTSTDQDSAEFIRDIMVSASKLAGSRPIYGRVVSNVGFNMKWGLGSSSSLISNIAYMFGINPFTLHFNISGGSGYDIACARSSSPILYRLNYQNNIYETDRGSLGESGAFPVPTHKAVNFNPPFRNKLFFAYTGRKQDSASSVNNFLATAGIMENDIDRVTRLSNEIVRTTDIDVFTGILQEHDLVISEILKTKPVSDNFFKGFPGYTKYLGAWGGDFILVIWKQDVEELFPALQQKGINVVFPYEKLIHNPDVKK